jgi:hypothetical protein
MSEVLLLPRLHSLGVRHLLADLQRLTASTLDARMERASPFLSWGSSGGSRASSAQLQAFRKDLVTLAGEHGFPEGSNLKKRAAFDAACGAWLLELGPIVGGEALRDDIWAFVACCVAPDICVWRFEGAHPERFAGGVRNLFQRLWLRARAFDRGEGADDRWGLVQELTEDAMVQIVERPAIAADRRLASAIAEAWVAILPQTGSGRMEAVTRKAVRQLRISNEIICLGALERGQLEAIVRAAFTTALS